MPWVLGSKISQYERTATSCSPLWADLVNSDESEPKLIATSPFVNSTLGIIETTPDHFYVRGNNLSLSEATLGLLAGSNRVFGVDFTNCIEDSLPNVTELAHLRSASFFDGLTKLNDTLLLAADSAPAFLICHQDFESFRAVIDAAPSVMVVFEWRLSFRIHSLYNQFCSQ